jgi:hypothetical protein
MVGVPQCFLSSDLRLELVTDIVSALVSLLCSMGTHFSGRLTQNHLCPIGVS